MSVAYMTEETGVNCWFLCRWGVNPGEVTVKPVSRETGNNLIGHIDEQEFILLFNTFMCAIYTPKAKSSAEFGMFFPDTESESPDIRALSLELKRVMKEECADLRAEQDAWLERLESAEEWTPVGADGDDSDFPDPPEWLERRIGEDFDFSELDDEQPD